VGGRRCRYIKNKRKQVQGFIPQDLPLDNAATAAGTSVWGPPRKSNVGRRDVGAFRAAMQGGWGGHTELVGKGGAKQHTGDIA